MAKTPKAAAPTAEATTDEAKAKSIINPKYRGRYTADTKDWLAKFIDQYATRTKAVKVKSADGEGTETRQVPDGVDVDRLHVLAEKNGLNIDGLKSQSGSHGYPGRARMTIRNMLQTVAKQRHGLKNPGGTFLSAPSDWLMAKDAPEKPTHDQDGKKHEKPKADTKNTGAPAPVEAAA